MRQLPLQSRHETQGAHLICHGEWLLPEYFVDPISEYRAVREGVGIIDLSHDGKYLISGQDRVTFLQNLISNDIHLASHKRGIISALLSAKGKVISTFFLCPLTGLAGPAEGGPLPDAYFIDIASDIAEKTIGHLMKYKMRSKIKIEGIRWGKLLVSGPSAEALLSALLKRPLPDMEEGSFFFQGQPDPLLVIRTAQTGEDDYHLYCHEDQMEQLWHDLFALGEKWGVAPVGQTALNILRIEAGIPRLGVDIDEDRFPIEAGLEEKAISYTKGCYPGQEVVARIKTYGHVNRRLTGLRIQGNNIPQYRDAVFQADDPVGWVTSSVVSPLFDAPIAMAYLKNSVIDGTSVEVSLGAMEGQSGRRVTAVAAPLPFYERTVSSPVQQ